MSPQFSLKALQERGCHSQGKVRENRKFFKVREKSGNPEKVNVSMSTRDNFFLFVVHEIELMQHLFH